MTAQSDSTVSVSFALAIGSGKMEATAQVPSGSTNLTQILPVLQSLDDSLIAGVAAQYDKAGVHVSCRAGCGTCCRQFVPISIFEAEALAAWFQTLPEDRQQQIADRFHQGLTQFASSGLLEPVLAGEWFSDMESSKQQALEYLRLRIPCPFLEDESCSIHPIRPLICREYLVGSDPKFCYEPSTDTVIPIKMPLYFSRVLVRMAAEIDKGGQGWIPMLFLMAWMKSGARPGECFTADGPHVLFEFIKRVSVAKPPAEDIKDE